MGEGRGTCCFFELLFAAGFGIMRSMSNENKGFVSPAWPKNSPREHVITEITAPFAGASSPYGDDLILPMPAEKLNYVHPYTRINH